MKIVRKLLEKLTRSSTDALNSPFIAPPSCGEDLQTKQFGELETRKLVESQIELTYEEVYQMQTDYLLGCLVERLTLHSKFDNVIDGTFSYKATNPKKMALLKLWGDKWEKDLLNGKE